MFLDAVILILQEILEASLLLSVLLAVNALLLAGGKSEAALPMRWYWRALWVGCAGAALYAWAMPTVSAWFDYVGQEVANAFMQLLVICCLYGYGLLLQPHRQLAGRRQLLAGLLLVMIIAVGITREGSEILLYLNGIMATPAALTPVLLGCGVATGIGVSAGILLYFALLGLAVKTALRVGMVLLALFAGNMAAQAMQLLNQADWAPTTPQLWDSSAWLPEYTVTGQLLYALIGYEATPSVLQGTAYLVALAMIVSTPLFRRSWQHHDSGNSQA
jgi:high-affinity iron transporter